jgi:hypothetical protein
MTDAAEAAVEAAVNVLLADSGLPQYGPHRATVERRQRLAFDAAAPFLRAAHPEAGSEAERLSKGIARIAYRMHLMVGDSDEDIDRIIENIDASVDFPAPNASPNWKPLRAAHPEAERAPECPSCGLDVRVGMHCPEDKCPFPRTCVGQIDDDHPETERAPERKRWVQPEAFCEQPRCQAKNDGACHVPENCGHFQPKGRWEADRAPEDAA